MSIRLLKISTLLLFVALLAGCATGPKMAFENDGAPGVDADTTLLLMTVTLKNDYRPAFQPQLDMVNIDTPKARIAKDRLTFKIDEKSKSETFAGGNTYLLRIPVKPGPYVVQGLISRSCGAICALFVTPTLIPIEAKEPGVYYLGHMSATVRERQGNEFKAGPTIPLLDQAVAGASGGTFDVEISDGFSTDETMFRSRFAALKDVKITKAILPPFNREVAQKWWDVNGLASGIQLLPHR